MTSDALYAAAKLIGSRCGPVNQEFMQCKQNDGNPAACVGQGTKVVACSVGAVRRAKESCSDHFEKYRQCLVDTNNEFHNCREQETALRSCFDAAVPKQ